MCFEIKEEWHMGQDVIVACDFATKEDTLRFLDNFAQEEKPFVKIGMEQIGRAHV